MKKKIPFLKQSFSFNPGLGSHNGPYIANPSTTLGVAIDKRITLLPPLLNKFLRAIKRSEKKNKSSLRKSSLKKSFPKDFASIEIYSFYEKRELEEIIEQVQNLKAVFISTAIKIDFSLMQKSNITFIASPTSGLDHIDKKIIDGKKWEVASAPGCNSRAVSEYVLTLIFSYAAQMKLALSEIVLGIIGCGNVGSQLLKTTASLGIKSIVYDPNKEEHKNIHNLKKMRLANVISFHVPLTFSGRYKTYGMVDEKYFKRLLGIELSIRKKDARKERVDEERVDKRQPLIINSARAEIFDLKVLKEKIKQQEFLYAFDVWPDEPKPNPFFIENAWMATPHIAGYSKKSKLMSSEKVVKDFLLYFALCGDRKTLSKISEGYLKSSLTLPSATVKFKTKNNFSEGDDIANLLEKILPLKKTTKKLKASLSLAEVERMKVFLTLRKSFLAHKEFSFYRVEKEDSEKGLQNALSLLKKIGFKLK